MNSDINITYNGHALPCFLAQPDTNKKYPGIILIQEIWGLTEHIKDVADRVAKQGYTVIAPDLFADTPIKKLLSPSLQKEAFDPKTRDQAQAKLRALFVPVSSPDFAKNMLEKLEACFSFLESNEFCTRNIGVMGFCFGGTYSYALALEQPKLKAAVPFYGSAPEPLAKVNNISCPVLAFIGDKDERLIAQLPALKEEMNKYGKQFKAVVYPEVGHAFFNDTNPIMYNKEAASDAWIKTLTFLQNNLA